jgi:CRP/FNR family transcriptional regulator, cyclic AMP receptor protein
MAGVLEFCKGLPLRHFAAGEVILEEGQRAGVLYVLASGSVEVVKGDVQITVVSDPGSFFGEMSVLLDAPHMASVRALEDTQLHIAEEPLAFLRSNSQIALEVSRLLARRLHFVTTYLVDIKRQFEDSGDHLSMVDEVLETLVHHQEPAAAPGSDRHPDPKVE